MKKLRNKLTGKIIENYLIESADAIGVGIILQDNDTNKHYAYDSLAELNKDWEDYKDKPCVIDMWEDDCICDANFGVELEGIERAKECGLYFETREEAEKAVEKLKAWKRLRDKGFRFKGKKLDSNTYKHYIEFEVCSKDIILFSDDIEKDLDLLFGGEDEQRN